MRRLRFFYVIFTVFILCASLIFLSKRSEALLVLNFSLFILAISGYLYNKILSYMLAASSWIFLYPLLVFIYKMHPANALVPVFLFNYALLGCGIYKNVVRKAERDYAGRLKSSGETIRAKSSKLESLYETEDKIRERELTVVKLYEITKRMSGTLKLDEIMDIFASLLRENFTFRKCEIIMLKEMDGTECAGKVYKVLPDKNSKDEDAAINHAALIKLFHGPSDALYFTREAFSPCDMDIFKELIISPDAKTFAAVPLLSDKKRIGILAIEDLSYIDLEMAGIVSAQFALEIKKVLLYAKVEELAITDGLTGLYVRRYFLERLNEELNRSKRYNLGRYHAMYCKEIRDIKARIQE